MGEVFLAHDVRLERRVAIKWLHPDHEQDLVARERLRREALAAASLGPDDAAQESELPRRSVPPPPRQTRRAEGDHGDGHKLARLVYRMLRWDHEYVDKGLQYYEERHRQQQVHLLKKRAAKLGLQIIEPEVA
jgi:serine/threonine protein kinase